MTFSPPAGRTSHKRRFTSELRWTVCFWFSGGTSITINEIMLPLPDKENEGGFFSSTLIDISTSQAIDGVRMRHNPSQVIQPRLVSFILKGRLFIIPP